MASYPTLKSFLRAFGTESACQSHLRTVRWPAGVDCPRCGFLEASVVPAGAADADDRARLRHRCHRCDHHFSVTADTIFHDTHLQLRDWFLAIYLMGSIENGIQATQLKIYLGVNYETARNIIRRIRQAIELDKHFVRRFLEFKDPKGSIQPAALNRNRLPTLHAVVQRFASDELCRERVTRIRWPNGPVCPKCTTSEIRKIENRIGRARQLFRCLGCKKQFSVISGTLLHRHHLLSECFIAMYLMELTPRVSSKQLERLLGIDYWTAVRTVKFLRLAREKERRLVATFIGYNDPTAWHIQEKARKEAKAIRSRATQPVLEAPPDSNLRFRRYGAEFTAEESPHKIPPFIKPKLRRVGTESSSEESS